VRKALMDIAHCDGFIIDLRDNLGGLVNATLFCLELFLEEGKLATLESQTRNGLTKTDIFVKPKTYYKRVEPDVNDRTGDYPREACVIKGKPVVVLISEKTCSSAELFAAALLESGNNFSLRLSMGKQSAGKGIMQDTVPLNGCSLVVTSGRYLSPMNRWFGDHGQTVANGIKPDIRVESSHAKSTIWRAHRVLCGHLGKVIAPEHQHKASPAVTSPIALPALVGLMAVGAFLTIGSMMLTPNRK
jgi:C-terminal processing protease CtpA/Prc